MDDPIRQRLDRMWECAAKDPVEHPWRNREPTVPVQPDRPMDKIGFAIGNGRSREGFDLEFLRPHGVIAGCNALYRDFRPNILVAVDAPIIDEIVESGYDGLLYFRYGAPIIESLQDPDTTYYIAATSAGATSIFVLLIRHQDIGAVYLLGHDFYGWNGKVNNVYAGSPHYAPRFLDQRTSLFDGEIREMTEMFHWVHFFRVGSPPWPAAPDHLLDRPNFTDIPYPEMYERLGA